MWGGKKNRKNSITITLIGSLFSDVRMFDLVVRVCLYVCLFTFMCMSMNKCVCMCVWVVPDIWCWLNSTAIYPWMAKAGSDTHLHRADDVIGIILASHWLRWIVCGHCWRRRRRNGHFIIIVIKRPEKTSTVLQSLSVFTTNFSLAFSICNSGCHHCHHVSQKIIITTRRNLCCRCDKSLRCCAVINIINRGVLSRWYQTHELVWIQELGLYR